MTSIPTLDINCKSDQIPQHACPDCKLGERFNPYKRFHRSYIPEQVSRYRGLSCGAKLVYGRLLRYAGENGQAFPGIATLATECGQSETQTRKYLRELKTLRFVSYSDDDKHYSQDGSGGSHIYHFLWHECFQGDTGQPRRDFAVRYRPALKEPGVQVTEPLLVQVTEPLRVQVTKPPGVHITVPKGVHKSEPPWVHITVPEESQSKESQLKTSSSSFEMRVPSQEQRPPAEGMAMMDCLHGSSEERSSGGLPVTRDDIRTIAKKLAALRVVGVDDRGIAKLIAKCRQFAPDAQVAHVVQMIQSKERALRGAGNPTGWLLTAIPKCFEGESYKAFREDMPVKASRGKYELPTF